MRNHSEGFEKERRFHNILGQALCDCPVLKAHTVKRIIAHVAPEFLEGLFEVRPCVRRLRYLGYHWVEDPDFEGNTDSWFELGKIYESVDFNGSTYSIKGYPDSDYRIGCNYFEWIDDEEETK